MRQWIDLFETFMGSYRIKCDYGGIEQVELFRNPSKLDINKMLRTSEYASVRASLYPDKDDLLIVWIGDRVQHHDIDNELFGKERNYYVRLFIDRTGLSVNSTGEQEVDDLEENIIMQSSAIRRIFGRNFEIMRP